MRTRGLLALLLASVAVGLAACGGSSWQQASVQAPPEQQDGVGPFEHPRSADAVVVSVTDGADGLSLTHAPWAAVGRPARFPLYGDGTVVVRAGAEEGRDGRIPALTTYRLSEAGIQAVLRRAEDAGLLAGTLDYGEPEILDVGSTLVTLNAGGREIYHSAYALGLVDSVQPERRRALTGFIDYLETLATTRPDLLAAAPRSYEPESVDVYAWKRDEASTESEARLPWPLRPAIPALPASEDLPDARCVSIRGPGITAIARARWRRGPRTPIPSPSGRAAGGAGSSPSTSTSRARPPVRRARASHGSPRG